MAKLDFKNGVVKDYTIVLSTRDFRHLGQITGVKNVVNVNNLNSANELSFTICKYDLLKRDQSSFIDYNTHLKIKNALWEQIVDLKLIWVKELNEYFQITVNITDSTDVTKAVTATSLCEAELGQTNIYGTEINTTEDIDRDDYYSDFPTLLYRDPNKLEKYNDIWTADEAKSDKEEVYYTIYKKDEDGEYVLDASGNRIIDREATAEHRYSVVKSSSLLHRVLEKMMPLYTIKYVDESLCDLPLIREFSIDGTAIYDFLTGDCSEQYDCLFKFNTAERGIYVYDLYTVCNECGKREDPIEFTNSTGIDSCPECGSKDLKYFGTDTTILIDKENLTDSLSLETNASEIKNCFKLSAGDELMTSTIRLLNPNGTDYFYYFSESQMKDMPQELVDILEKYDLDVQSYEEECGELTNDIYNLTDDISYLESGMMPSVETISSTDDVVTPRQGKIYVCGTKVYTYNGEEFVLEDDDAEFYMNLVPSADVITAGSEAKKLTVENLSPIALASVSQNTSVQTVNSYLKNYAKVYAKSGYVKIDIDDSLSSFKYIGTYVENEGTDEEIEYNYGQWHGCFTITNYSDKEDVVTTDYMDITVTDKYEEFVRQKIAKSILDDDDDEGSIFDVLMIDELEDFTNALKLYGLHRLESFLSAISEAQNVLIAIDQATEDADLYEALYLPYIEKQTACQKEIDLRSEEIAKLEEKLEQKSARMNEIHAELNFEKNLGDYYSIFCAYRREQEYTNDNYKVDGLSNEDIISEALRFIEIAKRDLVKSGEMQVTISSTLNNLLVLPEFALIVDNFELGNWIRVRIDGKLYRLKLMGYTINFDSLQTIEVEFSTASTIKGLADEISQVISAAQSMSSTYSYVSKQAENGNEAKETYESLVSDGLQSGVINIKNNNNEEIVYDKHGILCRAWDDITGTYSDKQLKLTHNVLAFTDNNWKSVRQVIGEHNYIRYNQNTDTWITESGYGMTSDFVQTGHVTGSTIVGGEIYSENYYSGFKNDPAGTYIDLNNGTFSFAGGKLTWDGAYLKISSPDVLTYTEVVEINEELLQTTTVIAKNMKINAENILGTISVDADNITGTITVYAENINTSNKKIQSSQIQSITSSQITGTIEADSIAASNINGTIASSQIVSILSDKTVTGSFSGSVEASSLNTKYNGTTYTGITKDIAIGDNTLNFVNGLLVSVSESEAN